MCYRKRKRGYKFDRSCRRKGEAACENVLSTPHFTPVMNGGVFGIRCKEREGGSQKEDKKSWEMQDYW